MPKVALNDLGLRSLPLPQNGQADYWDKNFPSFGVRVSSGGSKIFMLNLDKTRRTIGKYGVISLAEAREEARRILAERTLGKVRPQSITFAAAKDLFLAEKRKSRRPSTLENFHYRLKHFPFKCQLSEISHQDVARRLAKIPTNAEHDHALSVAKTFFTWCHNRRYIDDNPTRGLSPHGAQSRARVLTDKELQSIWLACSQVDESPVRLETSKLPRAFATIVKLLILTGQRRGEIAALQTSWITKYPSNSNSGASSASLSAVAHSASLHNQSLALAVTPTNSSDLCTITLPASITKNGREHTFPIGQLASQLVSQHPQNTKNTSVLLFLARGSTTKPFNGWSKSKAALDEISGIKDWTLHDLRRTFATRLAEMGIGIHVIERLLNHASGQISGVVATYNRASYMSEMRQAVNAWEAHLHKLLNLS